MAKPFPDDTAFNRQASEFLRGWLAWRPQAGTALGLHKYDGWTTDFGRASIEAERTRLHSVLKALDALSLPRLSPRAQYDLRIVQAAVGSELFRFEELGVYTKNPMTYANALDVNIYIKRDFAPLEHRVQSLTAILRRAPAIFAAARSNLDEALPRPYVETAIEVANGSADFLSKDLVTAIKGLIPAPVYTRFAAANEIAQGELRRFVGWLQTEKLPKSHQNYALGRDRYAKMLRAEEMIQLPPEQVLAIGMRELRREQERFAAAAHHIDPTRKPTVVFKEIQKDHPTEQSLIPDTRKNLESIRRFVVDHHIVTIPSEIRARVEETPAFARATSFANMDTPGPFETKAKEAYYYVTPVEPEWPPEQKDEWLTAFNYYTTDVVSIHEAYPGHYVQFLCLNASPANRLEKILNSYAFVEGWAHYAEQLLLDEGFGRDSADSIRGWKYRLAQSDEALLRLCRLCVSIKTHCNGMSLEDATRFFIENCYYEPKPARAEALRGTFDPDYLYYTLGKLQLLKLRQDWQAQEGSAYSLQRFHDEVLRHGAPPIRLLREVMLRDRTKWDEIFATE